MITVTISSPDQIENVKLAKLFTEALYGNLGKEGNIALVGDLQVIGREKRLYTKCYGFKAITIKTEII